jgi:hypothetical protein
MARRADHAGQDKEQYMPGFSRRVFLRNASLGAAAAGAVAVIGPSAFTAATASGAAASPLAASASPGLLSSAAPRGAGAEVMAHIVDDRSGTISVYAGTEKVVIKDRAITEALLKALDH